MRVTVICSMYPPALAPEAPHAALLCKHLAASGVNVTLITSHMDAPRPPGEGFAVRDVMKGWTWRHAPQLLRELKASDPDVVLLIYLGWIYDRHPMITFLPTICRRLKKRPRVVVQFENTGAATHANAFQQASRKLGALLLAGRGVDHRYGTILRDADAFISLCRPHLRFLSMFTPGVNERAAVIPAPPLLRIVDDAQGDVRQRTRTRLGYGPDDFVLAYFGYVYPEKGVETVIESAGMALKDVPNLRLLMIGGSPTDLANRDPGYPDRLRARVQQLALTDRTHWTGHCEPDGEDASSYLHAADACMLPFTQGVRLNNSSYAVVTSHGLPVLTTRAEDLEEEFRDGDNVMLFPPGNAEAAAKAVVAVATDTTLRTALRSGALAYSRGRSSWDAVTRQTLEVLRAGREPRPATRSEPDASSRAVTHRTDAHVASTRAN